MEGETPEAAAVDVGRFTSDQEILIRFDSAAGEWARVPTRNTVRAGDRLLALPTFRPQLLLVNGIQMTLDGPTAVQLAAPDESGVHWVHVEYGRLLLVTVGKAGAKLGLQFGERRGVLAFRDADTLAALSVRRFQLPGIDPESREPHTRTELYATSGLVQWQQSGDAAVEVPAGRMRTFVDTIWAETLDVSESPKWIVGSDVSEIDQRASLDLRPELSGTDAGVSLRLLELAEHRRPEVRSLAVRCGAYLDEFEPFVAALNDPNQKSYWSAEVDVLGESIHRGPATAARVRQTLENHRAGDAQNLYRLLWGVSEEELKGGWDARLVGYLDHDSLDFRVLAIENLRRITSRTLLYRAEYAPDRRRSHVQRWSDSSAAEASATKHLPSRSLKPLGRPPPPRMPLPSPPLQPPRPEIRPPLARALIAGCRNGLLFLIAGRARHPVRRPFRAAGSARRLRCITRLRRDSAQSSRGRGAIEGGCLSPAETVQSQDFPGNRVLAL